MVEIIRTPQGNYALSKYETESELESAIIELQSELFGPKRIYLDIKKKIGAKGGKQNIPDGYLVDLTGRKPRLYVVENEISSHDPLRHVAVQLLEFSLSYEDELRKIKTIVLDALHTNPVANELCERFTQEQNYRNLDHMLESMIYDRDFAALVIIDDMSNQLERVLAERLKFGVEVLEISRYANKDGHRIYRFEPFLSGITDDLGAPSKSTETTQELDVTEVDTIVVPAQPEGFHETFLGEHRWHAIRIHGTMRPQIRHIAAYQIRPISAITHIAPVGSIEPWADSGKFVVNFAEPAHELDTPVKLVSSGKVKALQNIRYTTMKRLEAAKTLDEVW